MSFANSGDPKIDPREEGFESLPAGTYTMTGIADYFSKDELGLPTFKPVDNGLKAHCHFSIEEGNSSLPAWSGTKEDYYNLAKALGANVEGLVVEPTTEYLGKIQSRIDDARVSSKCKVGEKGWVKQISALLPPSGFYRLAFRNAFSLDKTEPLTFQDAPNKFNPEKPNNIIRLQFEIVSDIEGDTSYAGNTFLVNLFNPFEGVFNGVPAWQKAKNGGMLNAQRRLMTFMNIFWPDVEDYKWVADPEESIYGVDEAANPIVVIVDKARASGKQALCQLELTESGYIKMDLLDLKPAKGAPLGGVTLKAVPTAPTVKMHMNLIATINDLAYPEIESKVFEATPENPYHLSEKGAGWCKTNIAPIWDAQGLGQPRNFGVLTSQQASALVDAIQAKLGTSEF